MRSLIVAGSRTFNNFPLLEKEINKLGFKPDQIISGCANGADALGEKYAHKYNIDLVAVPAEWDKYGKSAGYKRNVKMAEIASDCIIFRIGGELSKGSTHMYNIAKSKNLNTTLIEIVEKRFIELRYYDVLPLVGYKITEQVSKQEQDLLRPLLKAIAENEEEQNLNLDEDTLKSEAYNSLTKIIRSQATHISSASFITTQEKYE